MGFLESIPRIPASPRWSGLEGPEEMFQSQARRKDQVLAARANARTGGQHRFGAGERGVGCVEAFVCVCVWVGVYGPVWVPGTGGTGGEQVG